MNVYFIHFWTLKIEDSTILEKHYYLSQIHTYMKLSITRCVGSLCLMQSDKLPIITITQILVDQGEKYKYCFYSMDHYTNLYFKHIIHIYSFFFYCHLFLLIKESWLKLFSNTTCFYMIWIPRSDSLMKLISYIHLSLAKGSIY